MRKFTLEDIKHISNVYKIPVSQKELGLFRDRLFGTYEMLKHFFALAKNKKLEKSNPMHHSAGLYNSFRGDTIAPGLSQKEALSGSQNTYNGYFVSPYTLE